MRVALVSSGAPARNAIGNQLVEKLEFFLDRAADVRVIVESRDRIHPKLQAHCLEMSDVQPSGPAWDFLSSADLVIADYPHYYRLLTLLPLAADGRRRVVLDYYGVTPTSLWGGHHRELLEAGLRNRGIVWCADAALAHSRSSSEELRQATAYPAERIKRLGFPLDLATFCAEPGSGVLRRRLGLEEATILLFVGRLAPNKRVPILIEALSYLSDVHAIVIGDTSDAYAEEVVRCNELAGSLGVKERLHFVGQLDEAELVDAYRSADALVIPSLHEGFCIPVVEAMACGLPVIAARATALPETVGDAGVSFVPDDPADLARHVRRVLSAERGARSAELDGLSPALRTPRSALNVRIVSVRYGTDFAGGAERSLRTIAETLHRAGHTVRVLTTCTRAESDWSNEVPAGATEVNGVPVIRFPIDVHDRERHLQTVEQILRSQGPFTSELEKRYLEHSIHSAALVEHLAKESWDAIIVGPYLFGLTHDVARRFPDKTLVLPCFHDEPFAHLQSFRETYEAAGGVLYHSTEEQDFAQAELGINHPRAQVIGTYLQCEPAIANSRPCPQRYLAYCGRYSAHKGVSELLEYARRYHEAHPDRFRFVFLGQGEVKIPREEWAIDLGFVSEERKHAVLADAEALIQLSQLESLSLVALEAWTLGVPVIANAQCAVVTGHVERSGGGAAVGAFEEFRQTLNQFWDEPELWKEKGQRGACYVKEHYGSEQRFLAGLESALRTLAKPLREQMRERGIERSRKFERSAWREQFATLVEEVLETPRSLNYAVRVEVQSGELSARQGMRSMLVPVKLTNTGTLPALPEGPARTLVYCQVHEKGKPISAAASVCVPELLCPGQTRAAAVPLSVPNKAGVYEVALWTQRADWPRDPTSRAVIELRVSEYSVGPSSSMQLESVDARLAEAFARQKLPDDYLDVTEGVFAGLKRRIKKKLLNNFKRAYVDVLSRQQTQVNRSLIEAVRQLAESCATLHHAVQTLQERIDAIEDKVGTPQPAKSVLAAPEIENSEA